MERLLSFSQALDHDLIRCYQRDLDTLTEEEMELAQLACSAIEGLWKDTADHSVFTVAA